MEFRDFFHVRNSVYGPKGGEQHSLADEGAQFRQIDRKPGTLHILWGKLYKYTYLYTQRRNIQYKKRRIVLWLLLSWGTYTKRLTLFCCRLVFSLPTPSQDSTYLHELLLEEKDKERGRKRWTFLAVKAQRGGEANKTTAKKCELLLIQYSLESLES
jgi:hypothetical protein